MKERKEARHEEGVFFLFYVPFLRLLTSQTLLSSLPSTLSFLILISYVRLFLPKMRWRLWPARLDNGKCMVVRKLSSCWLVGAATCHAFLGPSLVSKRRPVEAGSVI